MDSEPRYEDHPACFKPEWGCYWNEEDVRQNAYWDMMEGYADIPMETMQYGDLTEKKQIISLIHGKKLCGIQGRSK